MTKRYRLNKNPKIIFKEEKIEYLYLDHQGDVLFVFVQILNTLIKKIVLDFLYYDVFSKDQTKR